MLQKDDITGTELYYGYYTMEKRNEENNTKDNYLMAEVTLKNLPTQTLYDEFD